MSSLGTFDQDVIWWPVQAILIRLPSDDLFHSTPFSSQP